MEKRAVNAFVGLFLLFSLISFATDTDLWPFLPFDFFTRFDSPSTGVLRFTGIAPGGAQVDVRAEKYFRYLHRLFFMQSLIHFHEDEPQRFARIMATLRARYNAREKLQLSRIRVVRLKSNAETDLGEYE